MLGYQTLGSGQRGVIVMNDWLSDTSSSWGAVRDYLDDDNLTRAFADLRGYGRSITCAAHHGSRHPVGVLLRQVQWSRSS